MSHLLYDALVKKDESYVGKYYVAVKTTGVYCNMNCPCKKPLYENTLFFSSVKECLIRGYRECKRCRPISLLNKNLEEIDQNEIVAKYITWLEGEKFPDKSYKQHPIGSAEELNLIKSVFEKSTGISLGKYIRVKRVGYILNNDEKSVRNRISFDYVDSPLGEMIACYSEKGLILLEFIDRKSLETELAKIRKILKGYFVHNTPEQHKILSKQITEYFNSQRKEFSIELDFIGTEFQKQVWKKLANIPYGEVVSYSYQAGQLGRPNAVRAIANANGKNMISIIIPCHRVIASNGKLTGYGGGIGRKKWLLDLESKSASLL